MLSWNRSALAIAANGGLLVREGFTRDLPAVTGIGFAVICLAASLWVVSASRYRTALGQQATHLIATRQRSALMLTAFVVVLSGMDLALAAT